MAIVENLKILGIDIADQIAVIRMIRSLSLSDIQKNNMLTEYLSETHKTLSEEGKKEAIFLPQK